MLVLEQAGGKSFRKFSSLLRGFADEAEPGAPGQQLSMAFPSTPLPACMAAWLWRWGAGKMKRLEVHLRQHLPKLHSREKTRGRVTQELMNTLSSSRPRVKKQKERGLNQVFSLYTARFLPG